MELDLLLAQLLLLCGELFLLGLQRCVGLGELLRLAVDPALLLRGERGLLRGGWLRLGRGLLRLGCGLCLRGDRLRRRDLRGDRLLLLLGHVLLHGEKGVRHRLYRGVVGRSRRLDDHVLPVGALHHEFEDAVVQRIVLAADVPKDEQEDHYHNGHEEAEEDAQHDHALAGLVLLRVDVLLECL